MNNSNLPNRGATQSMFSGDLSFMGCERIYNLDGVHDNTIVVLGIPYDTSTSNRPGTRFGPRAVRIASKMLSWEQLYGWDNDLYRANQKKVKVYDLGDVKFDYGRLNEFSDKVGVSIKKILDKGAKPLILGGDHFISYPVLKAMFKHSTHRKNPIALIHFDAHSDTWGDETGRIDHGTGFYHAIKDGIIDPSHSIQIGIRTYNKDQAKIETINAFDGNEMKVKLLVERILNRVGNMPAYLTFDIDVLDPSFAPGTGTPVVGGLSIIKVLEILRKLKGVNLIGADMVEVSPPYDVSEITALAGATIAAYEGQLLSF